VPAQNLGSAQKWRRKAAATKLTGRLGARIFKDYIARMRVGRGRLRESRSLASLGITSFWRGLQKRRLAAALQKGRNWRGSIG
jgi:hypothetical protein